MISLVQGEFMSQPTNNELSIENLNRPTPDQINIIQSTLSVKCSGNELQLSIEKDLQLPEGKTIAELLYDQEKNG